MDISLGLVFPVTGGDASLALEIGDERKRARFARHQSYLRAITHLFESQPNFKAFCSCVHGVNPLANSCGVVLDFHRLQTIKLRSSRGCNHDCS